MSTAQVAILDDDRVIIRHLARELDREHGIEVRAFNRPRDLLADVSTLDLANRILIDCDLGKGEMTGVDVAERLQILGFRNLILSSGFRASVFDESVRRLFLGFVPKLDHETIIAVLAGQLQPSW